jgi:hypothetical protein
VNGKPPAPPDPVDRIVRTIENATISQLQQAFRRLGWPIAFTVTEMPQVEYREAEEPTP